jgi:hypothetical protein
LVKELVFSNRIKQGHPWEIPSIRDVQITEVNLNGNEQYGSELLAVAIDPIFGKTGAKPFL